MAAIEVVDAYLGGLPGESRSLAPGEWGLTLPPESAAGWPLDIGLRLADGLLRVQAEALPGASDIDAWMLLWWNRQTRLIRFACTRAQDIWVHGEAPVAGLDERGLDRLLGLVVEGCIAVREHATAVREPGAGK